MRKPFPSKVNWLAFWRHRWVILNLVNQIAYGDRATVLQVVEIYGGNNYAAALLYQASKEIIEMKR